MMYIIKAMYFVSNRLNTDAVFGTPLSEQSTLLIRFHQYNSHGNSNINLQMSLGMYLF